MTDILSRLHKDVAAGNWTTNDLPSALAYNQAIHEARGVLRDPTDEQVEQLCEVMHDAYEVAAIGAGWETQVRSRKPWVDVPEANKATMRVAVRAVLAAAAGGDE